MNDVGKSERETQNRVIRLFQEELGYRYLGDWSKRQGNSNIERGFLYENLILRGYTKEYINAALRELYIQANDSQRGLYHNNKTVYELMRYGVSVKIASEKVTETIHLIDWKNPEKNDFAIAEEVTLKGNLQRRPDIVLYINGLAVGVLELKNSRVSIGEGIRQNLSNQLPEFNEWFFSTVQFIFAGNDSEGLKYGTINTGEKFFLQWKEDVQDNMRSKLDKYLLKMCEKHRIIELMYDFILFDGGVKKLPRAHQYFAVKKTQKNIHAYKGGIIWHTQGSGKSIVMVLLARWILENNSKSRVAIITDRDELDKQIKRVFEDAGEQIKEMCSGRDLISALGQSAPRLLCSLIHKFGIRNVDSLDAFIKDMESQPSVTVGEVFVFVDECHRTQSGKLHRAMKSMMPNATFIGFTGTPLLKKDKQTSMEVFGRYIDTYKLDEAVEDKVVLDLVYEARDIDQELRSQEKIDQWFDAKTRGLNDWKRDELKKKWGTMQKILSSRSRTERVVNDIILDFNTKPRLFSKHGNAILVASSIFEACRYYELFQKTELADKCALITSYRPHAQDVTKEEIGANSETDKRFIFNIYTKLLKNVNAEAYESDAKRLFVKEPANMRLLIVVDKLLTGFDAPPCTYLYIDKHMQDHGLFQAICRTNRLDGEDKPSGYVVDYKDLFKKVGNAITVYTSELDSDSGGADSNILLQNRLERGRERLDAALEQIIFLCEPVESPKGEIEYIRYFCGNSEIEEDIKKRQSRREALYKTTASLLRSYGNIADEMEVAKYTSEEIVDIKRQVEHYTNVRQIVKNASGEMIDLKAYESDMRRLIDNYIEAKESKKISQFGNLSLIEIVVNFGIVKAISDRLGAVKKNKNAVAESIENNVRSKILKEHLNDPAYYDEMSKLLGEIIADRKAKAIEYEEYLRKIEKLIKRIEDGKMDGVPEKLDTPGKRALYNNLGKNMERALRVHEAILESRRDNWREREPCEREIKGAIYNVLGDEDEVNRLFLIIKAQQEY